MTKEKTIGLVLIAIGVLFIILTSMLPQSKYGTAIGANLFPYIASIGLVLCGIGQLFRQNKKEEPFLTRNGWFRILKMTVLIVAFPFILNYLGFIVASLVLLFGMAWLFDVEKKTSVFKKIIYAIILTAIIYALFQVVLNIRLPNGVLFDLIFG